MCSFDLLELPELIVLEILLSLEGRDLHRARQVCRAWDGLVRRVVWATRAGRARCTARLAACWQRGQPAQSERSLAMPAGGSLALLALAGDGAVLVVTQPGPPPPQPTLTVTETGRGEWEAALAGAAGETFLQAELTSRLVAGLTDCASVGVWDRASQRQLYSGRHPASWPASPALRCQADTTVLLWSGGQQEQDRLTVLGRTEAGYQEVGQAAGLPGGGHILDLALPHLLLECDTGLEVWLVDRGAPTQLARLELNTRDLELAALLSSTRLALTRGTNTVDDWVGGWAVEVWSVEPAARLVRLPPAGYITDLSYCAGRLVLARKEKLQPRIVVYDTEPLLRGEIAPDRSYVVDSVSSKVFIDNTTIYFTDYDSTSIRLICWNFWAGTLDY